MNCHLAWPDERLSRPAEQFTGDIHSERGFGCVACHGGDATVPGLAGMDPARGFVGKPEPSEIPALCGRCHSDAAFMRRYNPSLRVDQVAEYQTSVHGQRLIQFGDTNVATCASCHQAHSIKPPSDPLSSVHPLRVAGTCGGCHADQTHMEPYDIPTDQLERYQRSIHWQTMTEQGDLSAPTCNDCHGNHGAAPPGISWVGNVCGQCHAMMAELFAQSLHARLFTFMGQPGCATCHGNHDIPAASDEMLGLGEGAVCSRCHTSEVGGGAGAAQMRRLIDSLGVALDTTSAILTRAEQAGMEVSEAQFDLNGARDALVRARTAVHAFKVDAVRDEVGEGVAVAAQARGRGLDALDELSFRRKGLAVSVVIIVALITGLVLKIHQLEERKPTT